MDRFNLTKRTRRKEVEETMNTKVLKKNNSIADWEPRKIVKALMAASGRETKNPITESEIDQVVGRVEVRITTLDVEYIATDDLHSIVMQELADVNHEVYLQYKGYREFKKQHAKAFSVTNEAARKIIGMGDDENANKDSELNSTKATLIGESATGQLVREFEMPRQFLNAHDEGWIYIHDLNNRLIPQFNCCLFKYQDVLKNIVLNGVEYEEINQIRTAFTVLGDIILQASAQQYGGFSLPEVDKHLAPYAEYTYRSKKAEFLEEGIEYELARAMAMKRTIREIRKSYLAIETKLNTINSSLGQTPFVTISFGLSTDFWAKEITKVILETRMQGLGVKKITAIFPKLVFLHRNEVNGLPTSPNYDLKLLAVKCSETRLYPDWLSLDAGSLGEVYDRCQKAVTPMGCRAFLSPFNHPETGEEIYEGRCNVGAVTLNLPKMALASKGNVDYFMALVKKYSDLVFRIHEWTYDYVGKAKGSSNPLYYCEGGAWMSVGYDDNIAPILEAATASLGYVGIQETCYALFGSGIYENHDFALELVQTLRDACEAAKEKYHHLYALYSTPAESLVYKVQMMNRKEYGVIPFVTDKDYCTNSFHIPVWEELLAPEKIMMEEEFHKLATGGRITYNEYKYGTKHDVLLSMISFAMEKGLYYGVNIVSGTCNACGHHGDFDDECPMCHAHDTTCVTRNCGYLAYQTLRGGTRYNPGKRQEMTERVKHNKALSEPMV